MVMINYDCTSIIVLIEEKHYITVYGIVSKDVLLSFAEETVNDTLIH